MNYRMICFLTSRVLMIETALLFLPLIVSLIYKESIKGFLVAIIISAMVSYVLFSIKPKTKTFFSKEGFITVGLCWVAMSLIGAIPFFVEGEIPNYIDALFETVSGFTTTGASILNDVESLSYGILFWRSFTHWIGGMGILIFMMAIIPMSNEYSMYLMRAEVAGPTVGKLVPKAKNTASILYKTYIVLTLIEIALLWGGGMPLYDSIVHAFGTAGTGGFGIKGLSIGYYESAYFDVVIGIFMLLFGVNFNLYYFIILRKFKNFFKNEELRVYVLIVSVSTILIAINIKDLYSSVADAFRYSFFQVSSIITTTGYATADFNTWPELSKTILIILMVIGGCAGSTGGGMKVSRIMIVMKTINCEIKRMLYPRSINNVKMEGHKVEDITVRSTLTYFALFSVISGIAFVLISFDNLDFTTTSTAVLACISNIGPGLSLVGPMGNFDVFSYFSKIVLSICMLLGRLEIFPMLLLFMPRSWKKY